jgi:hypothetical protein
MAGGDYKRPTGGERLAAATFCELGKSVANGVGYEVGAMAGLFAGP